MSRRRNKTNQATRVISLVSGLIFVAFSFIYLYAFQGDLLSVAQHLLSHGRTTYHVFIFSGLITLILTIVGMTIARFTHLPCRTRSLVWFPSFWALGWLTDVSLSNVMQGSNSIGLAPFIITGVLYVITIFILSRVQEHQVNNLPFSTILWPNLFFITFGIVFTCLVGNTNRNIHYELRMERLIKQNDYQNILEIGENEPSPSRYISAIRVYALSKEGKLGDELFQYPNEFGSKGLIPAPEDSLRPANLPQTLHQYLGGFPVHDMNTTRFLQYLAADTIVNEPVHDYLLCSLLLDRNLPTFVDSLIVYYAPKDTIDSESTDKSKKAQKKKKKSNKKEVEPVKLKNLPRYYAEALLLYARTTEKPIAILEEDKVLENYLDFLNYFNAEGTEEEREAQCRTYYNDTFWTYYYFNSQKQN